MSKLWLALVAFMTLVTVAVDVRLGGVHTSILVPWFAFILRGVLAPGSNTEDTDAFHSVTYINPATGLPMQQPDTFIGFDVGGHLYGSND